MNQNIFSGAIKSFYDWRLLVSAVILTIMVYIRDMDVFYFTPMHFLVVTTIIAIILPYDSLLVFAFFHIPFEISILCTTDIPILLFLILKLKKHNRFQFIFGGLIVFIEFIFMNNGYGKPTIPKVELNEFVVYGLVIVMFFYLLFIDKYNDNLIRACIKYYIIGTSVVLIILFIHTIAISGVEMLLYMGDRLGDAEGAFFDPTREKQLMYTMTNSNNAAYFSITAFSLSLYVKSLFSSRLIKIVAMTILIISGLLTASRTWVLLMALILFVYIVKSDIKGKTWFVIAVVAVAFSAIFVSDFSNAIVDKIDGRFNEKSISTAGLRTELFSAYNNYLLNNTDKLISGVGALRYRDVCGLWNSIHNGLQQIIVCYGFVGFFLFFYCGYVYYRRYIKKRRTRLWSLIPFLTCFFFDLSLQFLNPNILMLPYVVSLLPLKMKQD